MRFSLTFLLLSAALVCCALGQTSLETNPNYIVAVLAAVAPAPFKLEAWLHSSRGLLLLSASTASLIPNNETALCHSEFEALARELPSPPLFVGDGGAAAFDDNGDLYFERTLSTDGHENDLAEEWFLPFRHTKARPVPIGDEGVPQAVTQRRQVQRQEQMERQLQRGSNKGAAYKITVDAGHGGSDPGAVAQGQQEKAITLDISLKLRDLLLADRGLWSVQMTRSSDVDVSLTARTNMANSWPADRFVSIHVNSFTSSSAQGTETYSYAEGSTAAKLRDRIQSEMIKAWGLVNRGSKTENFHVLRETTMPATLSETGFITSPVDIVKLADPNARKQMAAAHLYAIQYHFGVSFNLPVLQDD